MIAVQYFVQGTNYPILGDRYAKVLVLTKTICIAGAVIMLF
jgi:hypothetical protein